MVAVAPGVNSVTLNGPVPIGVLYTPSSPLSSMYFLFTITAHITAEGTAAASASLILMVSFSPS